MGYLWSLSEKSDRVTIVAYSSLGFGETLLVSDFRVDLVVVLEDCAATEREEWLVESWILSLDLLVEF